MATLPIKLNDGTTIPWLAFGSGTALYQKDAAQSTTAAILAGFRHLDAAQVYRNEESVGAGIAASKVPRSELYITTKLSSVPAGKTVRDTLVESLAKLRTDYVDLFLVHTPTQHTDLKAVWREMEAVQAEGLARTIGVSNFLVKHLEQVVEGARIVPAVNQIEYHPYVHKATRAQLEYHAKHGIVATSYGGLSPVARFAGGPIDPVLKKIATRIRTSGAVGKDVTEGQVLQLWLRKKGIPCITTTSKAERLQEYLAVGGLPDLTDEEVQEIDEVGSTVHHRAFAKWMDQEAHL
ncbi:hypothetical protein EIP86_011521 [Pleurotus ostreatoroseus]|nr:hypothetical protein EIP86_011521 [Pleurotus ostreatoroseus]